MPQRLSTDPVTGHLMLSPSPTCMAKIGEPECGYCVYVMSGKEVFLGENDGHLLNGKKWSAVRTQSVYLPAKESYAPLAAYMINACKKAKCDEDVEKFRVRLGPVTDIETGGP